MRLPQSFPTATRHLSIKSDRSRSTFSSIIGIIILIVSYVFLFKTKWGLRLRACGEHPQAADSVGINVYQWRYTGVMISGALGGIGGFAYIVPSVTTWNFEVGVAGAGFLALAVMIFGQWKPFNIAGAAVFFCGIPFPGEHRGFHRACKPRIVKEYLQHDAVYRIHDYSCVYIQEFPGTESGGYSV